MQLSNNRRKWGQLLLVAGSVCCFLGAATYWYTDGFDVLPVPAPLPPAQTARPAIPKAVQLSEAPKPELSEPPARSEADAGTLHNFAAKQAQLDEVKLDVAIAEQQAKLTELRDGKPAPVVSHAVPAMSTSLPPLPPLAQPTIASTGNESLLPDVLPPARRTSGLVAIQGVDGNLSAVFATGNGKKTVRVGESIMGSKVRAISLDSVTLSSGKTLTIGD